MKNSPPFSPSEKTPVISWQYLMTIVTRRLWLFVACLVPVVLLAVIYLMRAPRVYESTAVVQVEQREQRAFKSSDEQGQPDDLKGDDVIKTIEQNLQNYSLFVNVVSNPKILQDPRFFVGYKGSTNPPRIAGLADWLRSNTKVALRHGTRLIDVTVDHQVPAMAQELAQAVIDSFVLMNGQAQNTAQQNALKLLVADSDQTKRDLQKSEDSLQIYKDSLLLKDRINDQQRVIDALKQRYREKHPQLIQARMLLADLMQNFDLEFKKVMATSTTESSYWASNSNDLSSATPQERISTELKLVEARSEVLQKEVDTESALFDNVLKQMRETDVNQDSAATDIRVVEPPPLPGRPAKPKKMLILLLSIAAGAVLGVGGLALANAIDSSIQTPVEAESLLNLPVLGTIPLLYKKKLFGLGKLSPESPRGVSAGPRDELVLLTDPSGAPAEAFRSLRASISLLGSAADHRTILFTSALPGEGKTFVSCNYALALAQRGLKTLLIDTDLRRPAVHSRMKIDNKIGFLEILTEDLKLTDVVHWNVAKNLDVLTAGGRCPNPAELLSGTGFSQLLEKALASYDRVVFDSSPVNLVSDSLLLANSVDSVCLVVRASGTARLAAVHAVNLLRRSQKEPSGIVLNAFSTGNEHLYQGYKDNYKTKPDHVYS
jgi:succinoglycan biosynthesis transport protein ExoP